MKPHDPIVQQANRHAFFSVATRLLSSQDNNFKSDHDNEITMASQHAVEDESSTAQAKISRGKSWKLLSKALH
jgi:hypothetical protein